MNATGSVKNRGNVPAQVSCELVAGAQADRVSVVTIDVPAAYNNGFDNSFSSSIALTAGFRLTVSSPIDINCGASVFNPSIGERIPTSNVVMTALSMTGIVVESLM